MTQNIVVPPPTQYRDSRNLAARGRLHARYGTIGWFSWVADRLALAEGSRVLDVGCGPGWFWGKMAMRLPATLHLVLTDLFYGMVAEARQRVASIRRFAHVEAHQADAASLPFPDASFDAVLAMHMLYHVPDPDLAVREMARVLRPGRRLFVTTNGAGDMDAINALRARAFGGPSTDPAVARFGLDHARDLLSTRFAQVDFAVLRDVYTVTDPDDIFAYITSMPPGIDAGSAQRGSLRRFIEEAFAAGGEPGARPRGGDGRLRKFAGKAKECQS